MSRCALKHGSVTEASDYDGTCDTNIFINAFNGRQDTINNLDKIGLDEIVLSAVTVMELFQSMSNKKELARMKKKIKYYDVVQIDEAISAKAVEFIGATAVVHQIPIYTYNIRDFDFLPGIILYQVV